MPVEYQTSQHVSDVATIQLVARALELVREITAASTCTSRRNGLATAPGEQRDRIVHLRRHGVLRDDRGLRGTTRCARRNALFVAGPLVIREHQRDDPSAAWNKLMHRSPVRRQYVLALSTFPETTLPFVKVVVC